MLDEHVLVIRNQTTTHRSLHGFLRRHGYTVTETSNCVDTIKTLSIASMIILDMLKEKPSEEDISLIREIRDSGCMIPILVITSSDSVDFRNKVEEFDIVSYISKPIDFIKIREEIKKGITLTSKLKKLKTLSNNLSESLSKFILLVNKKELVHSS